VQVFQTWGKVLLGVCWFTHPTRGKHPRDWSWDG